MAQDLRTNIFARHGVHEAIALIARGAGNYGFVGPDVLQRVGSPGLLSMPESYNASS